MPPTSQVWSGRIRRRVARMPEIARREWREDRYGFLRWLVLPREGWNEWWDRIFIDPEMKRRLRAHARFCLQHRGEHSRVGLPIHGIVLLYGPPGTGKSSLARGLAQVVAEDLAGAGVADEIIFAEVDPHALPSQMLGESQRNAINLLEKSLPELAEKGHPVIVVIDEVNSLAMRRSLAAGGRDPVDVMRATEAVLRGIDYLASAVDNVYVIATSNFVATIDEAMLDRLDLAIEFTLPGVDEISEIVADSLEEIPTHSVDAEDIADLAGRLVGRSGRDIRKLIVEALVTRDARPDDPLTSADIERAIEQSGRVNGSDAA